MGLLAEHDTQRTEFERFLADEDHQRTEFERFLADEDHQREEFERFLADEDHQREVEFHNSRIGKWWDSFLYRRWAKAVSRLRRMAKEEL